MLEEQGVAPKVQNSTNTHQFWSCEIDDGHVKLIIALKTVPFLLTNWPTDYSVEEKLACN